MFRYQLKHCRECSMRKMDKWRDKEPTQHKAKPGTILGSKPLSILVLHNLPFYYIALVYCMHEHIKGSLQCCIQAMCMHLS